MGNRILFVDDEKPILRAIERLFFDSGYEVLTVENGEAALRVLASAPVDVVVSDIRMPGMDGHQFLRKVKILHPETTRLILSGYADESAILNSIMDGSSNLYLLKPWDGQDIREKIARIFAAREMFTNKTMLDFANRLDNLSTVPDTYHQVDRLAEQGADVNHIAAALETDPTAAAAVLRVANNAFIGVKTGSVAKAVTFLGLTTVKTLVLSCDLFGFAAIKVPPFSVDKFVRKASTANRMMTRIYEELLDRPVPDTHQSAALFNDIGILMGLYYCPERYARLLADYASGRDKEFVCKERAILGMSHQEFGGNLLNLWGLPYPIVEAALFHHEPLRDEITNKELVAAAHIAGHYAWKAVSPDLAPALEAGAFAVLGLRQDDVRRRLQA